MRKKSKKFKTIILSIGMFKWEKKMPYGWYDKIIRIPFSHPPIAYSLTEEDLIKKSYNIMIFEFFGKFEKDKPIYEFVGFE